MSFTKSSHTTKVTSNFIISAYCKPRKQHVKHQFSSLNLDCFLGNDDGKFVWGVGGIASSGRNPTIKGGILTAELMKNDGSWVTDTFDLDRHISNIDGNLRSDVPAVHKKPQMQRPVTAPVTSNNSIAPSPTPSRQRSLTSRLPSPIPEATDEGVPPNRPGTSRPGSIASHNSRRSISPGSIRRLELRDGMTPDDGAKPFSSPRRLSLELQKEQIPSGAIVFEAPAPLALEELRNSLVEAGVEKEASGVLSPGATADPGGATLNPGTTAVGIPLTILDPQPMQDEDEELFAPPHNAPRQVEAESTLDAPELLEQGPPLPPKIPEDIAAIPPPDFAQSALPSPVETGDLMDEAGPDNEVKKEPVATSERSSKSDSIFSDPVFVSRPSTPIEEPKPAAQTQSEATNQEQIPDPPCESPDAEVPPQPGPNGTAQAGTSSKEGVSLFNFSVLFADATVKAQAQALMWSTEAYAGALPPKFGVNFMGRELYKWEWGQKKKKQRQGGCTRN